MMSNVLEETEPTEEQIPLIEDDLMQAEEAEDPLITATEAAELIGVSIASLRNYIKDGKMISTEDEGVLKTWTSEAVKVKKLRDAFATKWHEHVDDDLESLEASPQNDQEECEEDCSEGGERPTTIVSRIIANARHAKEQGRFEVAAELMSILIDHCDWEGVA